jgi:sec-independent protein translocase protein TatC
VEELPRLTLGGHLEELRSRLFRSVLALLAAMLLAMLFQSTLVGWATLPHWRARDLFDVPPPGWTFIAGEHTSAVFAILKLCFVAGLCAAAPVIAWQAWRFVGAGLHPHERRLAASFGACSFLLFLLGCAAGYFLLVPYTLYGLARMLPLDQVSAVFDFSRYVDLVLAMTVALGAVFQLPLGMALLTRLGVVAPSAWARTRRHAVVGNVLAAAFLSPPDPISMAVFAVPLLGLYEVGVVSARVAEKKEGRPSRDAPR